MSTRYLIDTWSMLEEMTYNASVVLHNVNNQTSQFNKIEISNNNDMKYLDVYINNSTSVYGRYTHIHSFVNEMTSTYGNNMFADFEIYNNNIDKIKRKYNINTGDDDNKIKRLKYE